VEMNLPRFSFLGSIGLPPLLVSIMAFSLLAWAGFEATP
jgi:hypothetical protein